MPLPIFAGLAQAGLGLLANAIQAKGKQVIEEKLGVSIPDDPKELTDDKLLELRQAEMDHEKYLTDAVTKRLELELEAEKEEGKQVTDRWKSDMASDSWLSKNIRPLVLAYLTGIITIMAFFSKWLEVQQVWVELLGTAYVTVLVAYFGSRGAEKIVSMGKKK